MSEDTMPSFDDADTLPRSRKGKIKGAVLGAALVGVFTAGFYFVVLPQFKEPHVATPDTSSELTDLGQRLTAAESKIEALEKTIADLKAAPVATATSAPVSNADTDAKIAALTAQLDTLSKTSTNPSSLQSIALVEAFTQLHKAAKQGMPFSVEMRSLTQLAAGRPKTLALLAALQPFEVKPAPTAAQLQKQLGDAIKNVNTHQDSDNSLGANLRSLIRIRKEGHAQGDDDESMIARAEAAMNDGDVAVASHELEQLSAAQMPVFENWLKNAKLYASEQAAIEALQTDILQPAAASPAP